MLSAADARGLQDCLRGGGVALFGVDTVYGLACDPEQPAAVRRLYALKGRPARQPAAVMFFSAAAALASLPELQELPELAAVSRAMARLLPGPITLLLPNPRRRFALACGPRPDVLGVRVPVLTDTTQALSQIAQPLLQSSANRSGGPEARRLADVDEHLRRGVDLVLDGGVLPGVASTVVDLLDGSERGAFRVRREGAMPSDEVARILDRDGGGG